MLPGRGAPARAGALGAVRLGGVDLRPLRLWNGVVDLQRGDREGSVGVPAQPRDQDTPAAPGGGRGALDLPADLGGGEPGHARDDEPDPSVVAPSKAERSGGAAVGARAAAARG